MSTVLHSGPVGAYPWGSGPPVIVGDPPQWDDNLDTTYATAEQNGDFAYSPYAAFDPMPELSTLEQLTITVRYSTAYPDGTLPTGDPRVLYYELWPSYDESASRTWRQGSDGVGHPDLVNDDGIHEFTFDLFPQSWMSPTDLAFYGPMFLANVQSGVLLNFYAGGGGLSGERHAFATIYKVTLEVTGAELVTSVPVARLWPRDDGRGISSAPRIYPRPKANRIVGGYR